MTDILIRDVPEDVIAAIDTKAQRVGLSRTEYLRRALAREGTASPATVSVEDLRTMSDLSSDLADPEVMRDAWQ